MDKFEGEKIGSMISKNGWVSESRMANTPYVFIICQCPKQNIQFFVKKKLIIIKERKYYNIKRKVKGIKELAVNIRIDVF